MKTSVRERDQQPWVIVATREIMVKLRDKAFIMGTLSTLFIMFLAMGVGAYFGGKTDTTKVVASDDVAVQMAEAVSVQAKDDSNGKLLMEVTRVNSEQEARDKVSSDDADVWLHQEGGQWTTTYKKSPDHTFDGYLTTILTGKTISELAGQAGVPMDQVQASMSVKTESLESGDSSPFGLAYIAGIVFAMLFMMSSMLYGMQIAQSVIEEKQSRIVEILVSAIPVRQLLTGKVLGNTVMAFVQLALILGAGLIGMQFIDLPFPLPTLNSAVAWFLIFFLAGFLALACIWAAAGALGTRNEDLQQTSQPLTWLLMIVYFAGFIAQGAWKFGLSFVPIVSSVLMPVRILEGGVPWWQPVIALALNILFAAVTIVFGAKIYKNALLQTSGRLSYRQALKLGK